MTEHGGSSPTESHPDSGTAGEDHPLGTLFVLMLFLMALVGMWGAVYLIYLGR